MNARPFIGVMPRRFIGVADDNERFPLGTPVQRGPSAPKPAPAPTPIRGRPNWVRDEKGVERYVEPLRPPVWFP